MSGPDETYEENGRSYHSWQRGLYWLPHDDAELERLDCLHGMMYNGDKLNMRLCNVNLVPEPGQPKRILDLGCGTGFWAMDMAESDLNTEVIGTDLINVQPASIPPNVSFKTKCNFNDRHWPFGQDSFDLIHLGMITAASVSWPTLYDTIRRHLRPGFGYIEQVDFDMTPHCDEPLRPDSWVTWYYEQTVKAAKEGNRPIHVDLQQTDHDLKQAGFVDIRCESRRINWHYYGHPGENYQIGGTFQVTMVQGTGFDAYCMAPFHRVLGWPKEQIDNYLRNVKNELARERPKIYSHIHVWTARRPGPT